MNANIAPTPADLTEPLYKCADAAYGDCGPLPAHRLQWFGGMKGTDGQMNVRPGWRCTPCAIAITKEDDPGRTETPVSLADFQRDNFSAAARVAGLVKIPFIYVASPYTLRPGEPDELMEQRIRNAGRVAAMMIRAGLKGIAPIPYFEAGARAYHHEELHPPEGYYRYDLAILKRCDALLIIDLPGWERSKGVALERDKALWLGLPIRHISLEKLDTLSPAQQNTRLIRIQDSMIRQISQSPSGVPPQENK